MNITDFMLLLAIIFILLAALALVYLIRKCLYGEELGINPATYNNIQ